MPKHVFKKRPRGFSGARSLGSPAMEKRLTPQSAEASEERSEVTVDRPIPLMTASSKKLAFSSACSSSDTSMVLRNATLAKTGEPDYLEYVGNMEGHCLVSCECLQ